jgi:hypothetical protein
MVYIFFGGDRLISCSKEVPIRSYIVQGTGLHESSSWVQVQEFYPSTSRVVSYCMSSSTTLRVFATDIGRGPYSIPCPRKNTLCASPVDPGLTKSP